MKNTILSRPVVVFGIQDSGEFRECDRGAWRGNCQCASKMKGLRVRQVLGAGPIFLLPQEGPRNTWDTCSVCLLLNPLLEAS